MEVSALKQAGAAGINSPLLRLTSDERLIAMIRRGNHGAFEALVKRYQARLLAFCRHMLGSKEDAEDVLQEVFAELRWEPLEFTDLGHAVVVETRLVGRGRGSDVPIEAEETDVFWFRKGQIVRVQGFATKEEALAAARESAG